MDLLLVEQDYLPNGLRSSQEKLSGYRPGGYHPVCLGDTFKDGRYEIFHKLGWGKSSTVWLARDRESQCAHQKRFSSKRQDQWVSLKISTANSSRESQELSNLQLLKNRSKGSLSSKYIVQLLDSFVHQGPNGQHQCLVFELLGPTVTRILREYYVCRSKLQKEVVLRMSEQLLKAIKFIHDAGMGHGGNMTLYQLFSVFHIHSLKFVSM
jgi:serine/threonine-protein kinase SRPK3